MPPEVSVRDKALVQDMILAAQDATSFVTGMSEADFLASRLHQNAVIRSIDSPARRPANSQLTSTTVTPKSRGAKSLACAIALSMAMQKFA